MSISFVLNTEQLDGCSIAKKKKIDMKTNKKKATKKSTTAIYDKRK